MEDTVYNHLRTDRWSAKRERCARARTKQGLGKIDIGFMTSPPQLEQIKSSLMQDAVDEDDQVLPGSRQRNPRARASSSSRPS